VRINAINNTSNKVAFGGLYNSKLLKKSLEFAANNGALFSAGVTLGFSAIIRPAAILAAPKAEVEDKKYACAKSISSSLVGYGLMLCASKPVANAILNIDKNPNKYLSKETIEHLTNGAKNLTASKKYNFATQLFKLGLGLLLVFPKSELVNRIIPKVMSKLFKNKADNKEDNKESKKNIIFTSKCPTDFLSKGIGNAINSKFVKGLADNLANTKFEMHLMTLTDILATYMFVNKTRKNSKIEEKRKDALISNSVISTGLSILGSYSLDKLLDKPTQKFVENFIKANKNSLKLDKYLEGIRVAKPVLIMGAVYYVLIPLISTYLSGQIKNIQAKANR